MINAARARLRHDESGFTLIELLIVITILGILAAVVVFSVGGINDKGDESACKTDYTTLQTAEEAYYARNSTYGEETDLVGPPKFISTASKLHNINKTGTGTSASYTINTTGAGADAKCTPFLP